MTVYPEVKEDIISKKHMQYLYKCEQHKEYKSNKLGLFNRRKINSEMKRKN